MAAQATHDLAIKTGEYTDRTTGEVKARWLKIGTVFKHDDGGTSIKLDSLPIGLPEWNGWVNVFKREDQRQGGSAQQPAPHRGNGASGGNGHQPQQNFDDFDDDIPF